MKEVYIILPGETRGVHPKYAHQVLELMKWFQKYVSKDIKRIKFRNMEDIKNEI